jgi:hypothetical protein
MKINRVFDIIGGSRFVPNGWNYKFTNTLWDYDFSIWHEPIDEFNKIYRNISIFEANLNLPEEIMNFLSISNLYIDSDKNRVYTKEIRDENFYFTIHPYGDVYTSLGKKDNYHGNISVFDNISKKAKKLSWTDNFYIIFDYSTEGDINPDIFYYIHEECEKNNINVKNVIVISSSANTFELYNDYYVKENNPKNKLKAVFYPWSLLSKAKDTEKMLYGDGIVYFNEFSNKNTLMSLDECKNSKNREKKGLCFNRRMSHHRMILLSFLTSDNLLETSHVSFDMEMLNNNHFIIDIINDDRFVSDKNLKNKCVDGFRKLKKIKKKTIDVEDIKGVWGFAFEYKESYINSYFSIVTETLFYQLGNYISEKTWKPIQHLHPFVIVGRPGTLKYLKQLGFKTFSDFWDESYDDIQEDDKRLEVVYSLITKLINLSNDEWDNMYNKLIPILEHNRKKLVLITEQWISETYFNNITKLVQEHDQKTYSLL